MGDGTEEAGEGEGTVAGEGPSLAGSGYQDGEAHEELDDEKEGHEPQGAVFAYSVEIDLVATVNRRREKGQGIFHLPAPLAGQIGIQ